METNALYPKLRFEEFSEVWQSIKLGSLLEFKNGVNASKENYGRGYKFVNVLDILSSRPITYNSIRDSVELDMTTFEQNTVQYGDILFQRSSETIEDVGKANVYIDQKPATFGGFVIRGKKKGEYDPLFMFYLFKTSRARRETMRFGAGSTRYNIGQESLKELQVYLPSYIEQQEIASFLSSIDKKIELLQKKKDKLEEYKKGMMQQIFSQELRFKDENGMDFEDWRTKKLKDIFSERKEFNDSLELLAVTQDKGVIKRDDIDLKDNSNSDKSKYKVVRLDDIAYNSMRMWQGAFGISKYLGLVSPAYTVIYLKGVDCDINFFHYYFKTPKLLYNFYKYSQGLTSDTWNLKYPLLSEIKITLPCLEEQQKIASFLSSIDKKVELTQKQIDQTTLFKKALLQQMFV